MSQGTAERDQLVEYLASDIIVGNVGYPRLSKVAEFARRTLPPSVALRGRLFLTNRLRPIERRKALALAQQPPVRLHLACGRFRKDGWINMDLFGGAVDVAWNVLNPLPFDDGSVHAVFSEHFLEHLSITDAVNFLAECRRVLQSGGVLRIGVPDTRAYLKSYVDGDDFVSSIRPNRPTQLLAVQEVFYRYGHKTMYDLPTLEFACAAAGFTTTELSSFGEGRVCPSPDSTHRRLDTLYVEVVK
jgi:predicted SAM-dependent methyltransferase